jgi:hypothetical protein
MQAPSLEGEGRAGYVAKGQAENNDKDDGRHQPFERESFIFFVKYHFDHLPSQFFPISV